MRFLSRYLMQLLISLSKRSYILPFIFFFVGFMLSGAVYDHDLLKNDNIKMFKVKNSIITCFTPPKGCAKLIEKTILTAKKDLFIQAYGFTHPDIINAVLTVAKRGVNVIIILDKSNISSKYSGLQRCFDAKIPVFIDTVASISHNKIVIIDHKDKNDAKLITGSFNFSKNAFSIFG